MTPEQLKASILQYAIQGKLVEQRPEEGPADALIEEIRKEKEQLIADGKSKSSKKLAPISDIEKPFDIPDSWKSVYLQDVSTINGGYAFKSTDYTTEGTRVIRISDFNEEGFVDNKIVRHPYKEEFEPFLLNEKDILLCMTGGTVGKSYFVRSVNEPMMTNQRVATIKILGSIQEYINYVILSPITQNVIQASKTSTNDNISMDTINSFLIPLPPFNEAKRIVAKIEEMLPFVERYAASYEKLEQFNAKFPEDMKKSILQYAIQGKLVEQRPEEGTAEDLYKSIQEEKQKLIKEGKIKKEKPLAEITEDEIPFDIPASWKWERLGNLLIIERGGSPRPIKEFITTDENGINWIKIGDTEKGSKYINSCAEKIIPEGMKKSRYVEKGDFILSNSMSFGRPYILNIDGCIHDGWLVLRQPVQIFDNDYLYYLLSSPMVFYQFCGRVAGAVVNNLNSDKVALTLVPIPPIEEQKRIAKKIEKMLPYCDQLIK